MDINVTKKKIFSYSQHKWFEHSEVECDVEKEDMLDVVYRMVVWYNNICQSTLTLQEECPLLHIVFKAQL